MCVCVPGGPLSLDLSLCLSVSLSLDLSLSLLTSLSLSLDLCAPTFGSHTDRGRSHKHRPAKKADVDVALKEAGLLDEKPLTSA